MLHHALICLALALIGGVVVMAVASVGVAEIVLVPLLIFLFGPLLLDLFERHDRISSPA